jgi:hypothetical protein
MLENDDPKDIVVYGVNCVWWDTMDKLPQISGLLKCPHCASVLWMMDRSDWDKAVAAQDVLNHGYKKMIEWSRGKCFPSFSELREGYRNRE